MDIGWAVRGKPAGSLDEYSILAQGGSAFSPGALKTIIARFSLGNPPTDRESPGALPWIGLSQAAHQEQPYIGLTIHEWSRDSDGAGRRILYTKYFSVPFAQMSRGAISYVQLYEAVKHLPLPGNGEGLRVEIGASDAVTQAAAIEEIGFDKVAVAAAMLLEGSVTIARGQQLSVAQRLAFLDAVASLLPYGWRTRFAAGTWHENGSKYVRLAFARHQRPDSFELDMHAPGEPPWGTLHAGTYLSKLRELVQERGRSLADVVDHLARQTTSMAGTDPAETVRVLGELDWPFTVARAAGLGTAEWSELVKLLSSARFTELRSAQERMDVLCALIKFERPEDLELIVPHWGTAAAEHPQPFELLVQAGRRALWRATPALSVRKYVDVARRLGFADPYLARLIKAPADQVERPAGAASVGCAASVAARILETTGPAGPPYPETVRALADNVPVLFELISVLIQGNHGDPLEWFSFLELAVPSGLREPLRAVLMRSQQRIDAWVYDELAHYGKGPLLAFMQIAIDRQCFDQVWPAFVEWSAASQVVDDGLARCLSALQVTTERDQGLLDGLMLWLGREPQHIHLSAHTRAYQEATLDVYRDRGLESTRQRIVQGLTSYLHKWPWASDERQVSAVLGLVNGVLSDERVQQEELVRAVVKGQTDEPSLAKNALYVRWRQKAAARYAFVAVAEKTVVLAGLQPDTSVEEVGRLCTDAIRNQIAGPELLGALLRSSWTGASGGLFKMLLEVRSGLIRSGYSPEQAEGEVLSLAREIAVGERRDRAADLYEHATAHARAEIQFQLRMLRDTAFRPVGEHLPQLSSTAVGLLTDLEEKIDELAKDVGGRRRWKLR